MLFEFNERILICINKKIIKKQKLYFTYGLSLVYVENKINKVKYIEDRNINE